MNKQISTIGVMVVLLIVSIANYLKHSSTTDIRGVDFLTIWVIGALSGLLIYKVIELFKKGK